ncbi:MAG: hypothetical protein KF690_07515 [Bacteroidetes bacterium]|nr:hypothetical protein [Bacteroidota bacterium]
MNTLETDAYELFLRLVSTTDWAMLTPEQQALALQFVSGEAEYTAYAATLAGIRRTLPTLQAQPPHSLEPSAALRAAVARKYGKPAGGGASIHRLWWPLLSAAAVLLVVAGFWFLGPGSQYTQEATEGTTKLADAGAASSKEAAPAKEVPGVQMPPQGTVGTVTEAHAAESESWISADNEGLAEMPANSRGAESAPATAAPYHAGAIPDAPLSAKEYNAAESVAGRSDDHALSAKTSARKANTLPVALSPRAAAQDKTLLSALYR